MNSIYNLNKDSTANTGISSVYSKVLETFSTRGNPLAGLSSISMEGNEFDLIQMRQTIDIAESTLQTTLGGYTSEDFESGMLNGSNITSNVLDAQMKAAKLAAIATSPAGLGTLSQGTEGRLQGTIDPGILGNYQGVERVPEASLEAFGHTDPVTATAVSVAYNYACPRQDEFAETFFPIYVTAPDTTVFKVEAELLSVMNGYRRNISGSYTYDFARKSLVLALVDPSILNQDTTVNVPVYRPTDKENISNFADPTVIPPFKHVLETGEEILTSALRPGKDFDLIGLSSTDRLIGADMTDFTDQLDPAVYLTRIWVKLKNNEVFLIDNLDMIPEAGFVKAINGRDKDMILNFNDNWVRFDENSKTIAGKASAASFATAKLKVNVTLNFNASINTDTARVANTNGNVGVYKVFSGGTEVAKGDPIYDKVLEDFKDAQIVGYSIKSRRQNANRRELGQLIDRNGYTMNYQMPLLAPISAVGSIQDTDEKTVSKAIDSLVIATHAKCNNNAVDVLLNSCKHLSQIPEVYDPEYVYNSMTLGISRFYVTPFYKHLSIDVYKELQTLQSSTVIADINAVLLKYIRDLALEMYIASNYGPAQKVIMGSDAKKPLLLIGTDPRIASYLQIMGDTRTFSDVFDFKIVHTYNRQVANKIFMTFGKNGQTTKSDLLSPLHYGNCIYRPELTTVTQVNRFNRTTKEITTQPSFVHIPHLPIMVNIDIENLPKAVRAIVPIKTSTI